MSVIYTQAVIADAVAEYHDDNNYLLLGLRLVLAYFVDLEAGAQISNAFQEAVKNIQYSTSGTARRQIAPPLQEHDRKQRTM